MKKNLLSLLILTSLLTLTGCMKKSDPNAIKVSCVQLGYGTEWLTALTKEYTKKTGVKFQYSEVVGQAGNNNLNDQLKAFSATGDLYGLRPGSFYELLYRGKINAKALIYVGFGVALVFSIITLVYDCKKCGGMGVVAFLCQLVFAPGALFLIFSFFSNPATSGLGDRREERRIQEERRRRGYDKNDQFKL